VNGVRLAAIGLVTPWGEGLAALPGDARRAAGSRRVVAMPRIEIAGDRFRRATRECLMGVAAVEAMLREARLDRGALAGDGTALVYVTAAAYGAANREFAAPSTPAGALHFPYTAPSAVAAEVAIEFGLRGGYVILVGGAVSTVDALWQAGRSVARGDSERALVLAVETFAECEDLYARARFRVPAPLVEAAACALLLPGEGELALEAPVASSARAASPLEALARRRAGETFSCAPLIALALGRESDPHGELTAEWRGRRAGLRVRAPASPAQSRGEAAESAAGPAERRKEDPAPLRG
jgi:hypothetical protein